MTPREDSWQKELQRNRDEQRRLDRARFYASIVFALVGFAVVLAILGWAARHALPSALVGPML